MQFRSGADSRICNWQAPEEGEDAALTSENTFACRDGYFFNRFKTNVGGSGNPGGEFLLQSGGERAPR